MFRNYIFLLQLAIYIVRCNDSNPQIPELIGDVNIDKRCGYGKWGVVTTPASTVTVNAGDAIGIYIDQILPLQDDVQNNQYATLYIEADDEEKEMKFKLVARGVDIIQKEEIWEAGKVIANIK